METQKWLLAVDRFSTWIGKAFAWLIVALMLMVVIDEGTDGLVALQQVMLVGLARLVLGPEARHGTHTLVAPASKLP